MRLLERFLNTVVLVVNGHHKNPPFKARKKESRSIFENWRPNATCFFAHKSQLAKKPKQDSQLEGLIDNHEVLNPTCAYMAHTVTKSKLLSKNSIFFFMEFLLNLNFAAKYETIQRFIF